jgi:Mrp family chromosome partitioning ATPase
MDQNGWKILGVTSPTPNCGKTLTAINLAFSIARQPQHSVVLADMDLRKPQIEKSFGLRLADRGVLDLLEERSTLQEAIVPICVKNQRISLLPTLAADEPSELMNIAPMSNLLQDLRRDFQTVILDLPPMLSCDDVFRILPQIDCVLLVAAVGVSKVSEVEECVRHLPSQLIRLVLNKSPEASLDSYYY